MANTYEEKKRYVKEYIRSLKAIEEAMEPYKEQKRDRRKRHAETDQPSLTRPCSVGDAVVSASLLEPGRASHSPIIPGRLGVLRVLRRPGLIIRRPALARRVPHHELPDVAFAVVLWDLRFIRDVPWVRQEKGDGAAAPNAAARRRMPRQPSQVEAVGVDMEDVGQPFELPAEVARAQRPREVGRQFLANFVQAAAWVSVEGVGGHPD